MAETLLSIAVEKLWGLLVQESERFHGVDKQFTELKSSINLLTSFLKDAEAKKHRNEAVKTCLEEMKEIVYDAEDIIETFLLKDQFGETSGIRNRVKRLAFIITERRGLAYEMEDITKRISKVITDMKSCGVLQVVFNGGYSSQSRQETHEREREMRETFSRGNESFLVGLEKNVERLVKYLVDEDDFNQVVSITGMGGIGKTTLAKQVFNHEIVKNHFENVAWVCVSQEFTRRIVWEKMWQNLSPKHEQEHGVSNMSDAELHEKLFGLLEKSLIVLDDVWKEEDWDRIKPVFPPNIGWRVLLTSRNEGVALHADPKCIIFKQECLTPPESWKLFTKIAFSKKDGTESKVDAEEMEEIGKQMVKHCGGLPLAIKVLGGLLAKQYTLHEWKRVQKNIGSQLINENTSSVSVHHVLSLSFEELPVYLKHCFLYLAHFPEDYAIKVEKLSYYWAAEEIPKPRHYNDWTILDVGQGYIEELVKRNMVISQRHVKTGKFEECQLHDMMREVCLLKAEQENFLQIVGNPTDTSTANSPSPCRPRRLIIYHPEEGFDLERVTTNPKLRSLLFYLEFFCFSWKASGLCFKKLNLLRVLCLSGAEFESEKLPSDIGKLIHLRYMNLNMAYASHIPYSLRNLKLLLYLNLNVLKGPIYVPNIFKEMQELRYLSLPSFTHEKTKLELGNLVKLETLENFSTKDSNVNDLRRMTRLRTLSFSIGLNREYTIETLSSILCELRHLEHLYIRDHFIHYIEGLPLLMIDATGLVFDFVNLKNLALSIYMPRLPQPFPCSLTSIYLYLSCLQEDPMPILEKLVHLTKVILWNQSFDGNRMVCSTSGFPKLDKLVMYGLENWEEWIVEERSMPLLRTLTIDSCLKLKELPQGLRFMTSLKKLNIRRMEREFNKKLEEGDEDYYKIQHIPRVIFLTRAEPTD